jgi:hypothetical protein
MLPLPETTPPEPYDRARRRLCATYNQGSRKRRFSTFRPKVRYYAHHRSARFAIRVEFLAAITSDEPVACGEVM